MIRLHLRIPRYRSEGSGEGMETPLDSWLRYWVVVSCAAIPDILLASLELLPHHDTLRTVFICWCLCPGPLSGTELLFNQVLDISYKIETELNSMVADISNFLPVPSDWPGGYNSVNLSRRMLKTTPNKVVLSSLKPSQTRW